MTDEQIRDWWHGLSAATRAAIDRDPYAPLTGDAAAEAGKSLQMIVSYWPETFPDSAMINLPDEVSEWIDHRPGRPDPYA